MVDHNITLPFYSVASHKKNKRGVSDVLAGRLGAGRIVFLNRAKNAKICPKMVGYGKIMLNNFADPVIVAAS